MYSMCKQIASIINGSEKRIIFDFIFGAASNSDFLQMLYESIFFLSLLWHNIGHYRRIVMLFCFSLLFDANWMMWLP